MAKQNVTKDIENLEQQIKDLKEQKKDLESKYTFKGLYKKVCGRDNILRELKDDETINDVEKFSKAIETIKTFVSEFE